MFELLTFESFTECLNDEFAVLVDDGTTATFELVEVSPLKSSASTSEAIRTSDQNARKQSFSLLFRGPVGEPFTQRMYRFEHGEHGTIEGLFITPVAADDNGVYYEAVFN